MSDNWPECTEAELQAWLDTLSPDYEIRHVWGDNCMAVIDRRRGGEIARQEKDRRCFVHPAFIRQVRAADNHLGAVDA